MNVVIIGGGPTGVELAGSIGELKLHILPHDYPELDLKKMQIHVVDMADRLLSGMSLESSRSAAESLKKFDVNLWLNTKVTSYDGKILLLSNGKRIISDTVILDHDRFGRRVMRIAIALLGILPKKFVDLVFSLFGFAGSPKSAVAKDMLDWTFESFGYHLVIPYMLIRGGPRALQQTIEEARRAYTALDR